jgi:lipopolysaccharide export system permease protein
MRKLDRYILTEFAGPFIFGIGVFFVLLAGISTISQALQMIVRENIPVGVVLQYSALRTPMMLLLTVPMAAMFASLMCYARLSGDGELAAMRAGGASVATIGQPIILASLGLMLLTTYMGHTFAPDSNGRARELVGSFRQQSRRAEQLVVRIPQHGNLQRLIYINGVDAIARVITGVLIIEFRNGAPWETFAAEKGYPEGKFWVLQNVQHSIITPQGPREEKLAQLRFDLGRDISEFERLRLDTDELNTAALRQELNMAERGPNADPGRAIAMQIEIAGRWSVPWGVVGCALVGIVLGIRPQRTSRGVALGISLVVILIYYLVMHTMSIVAEQGHISPVVCAWMPNGVLFLIGIIGLVSHDV